MHNLKSESGEMIKNKRKVFTIAVCDDEEIYREQIKKECFGFFQNQWGTDMDLPEIVCFSSAMELTASRREFDLLFLDIEMPGQDGIRVKDSFEQQKKKTRIIFMTSHEERVLEAFGENVVSFLVKPVDSARLWKVLEKTIPDIRGQVLELEDGGSTFLIPIKQIRYIMGEDKYTRAVMENGNYFVRRTMKFWEETLPQEDFARIHKSYLVNLEYFEKNGDEVVLEKGKKVKMSRKNKVEIMEKYKDFLRRKAGMI